MKRHKKLKIKNKGGSGQSSYSISQSQANSSRGYSSKKPSLSSRSEKRVSTAMRVLVIVIVVAIVVVVAAFIFGYLIPFMKAEFALKDDAPVSSSVVSEDEAYIPKYDDLGLEVYGNDINLMLINSSHPAENTDIPETDKVNEVPVNKYIADATRHLVEAAKEDGLSLEFDRGYVSYFEQDDLYEEMVEKLMQEEGYTLVMAKTEAKDLISIAGESDFQTGMCIKLEADAETFQTSMTYEWLNKNMAKFGFVFRFPNDKVTFTGRKGDYTIIRYVGRENAEKMQQLTMCLEEYVDYLKKQQS